MTVMAVLTIFTPTYNREYTLVRLYDSLKNQTKKDFIWQIVDDGSIDNTKETVEMWKKEGIVNIQYFWQENQGKPSATNLSIDKCETELWMCVDSDDILSKDAVEIIESEYEIIKDNNQCCGIIGGKYYIGSGEAVGVDGKNKYQMEMPSDISYISYEEITYRRKIKADKNYIYKMSIFKDYRYPIIENEKFIGESFLYEQLGTNYLYYISHHKVYFCEYLEDGLTANYLNLHIQSPKGYKILKEQMMCYPKPFIDKFKGAIMYVAACYLCKDKHIISNSPRKWMTTLAYPFGVVAYYKKYYKLIKEN